MERGHCCAERECQALHSQTQLLKPALVSNGLEIRFFALSAACALGLKTTSADPRQASGFPKDQRNWFVEPLRVAPVP